LICGETGSGKSTQIGQFLIEKNYCKFGKVVITQPRRLATIALANRVAEETGNKLG
jgi:HrpA-like RNA helicase